MNSTEQYIHDRDEQIKLNMEDRDLKVYAERFTAELVRTNYTKNFTWMGIPIIQYPTDLMVMQELVWAIKPDTIVETGIAFGGMLVFYASILESIGNGMVMGIDIDPRDYNMNVLEKHPLRHRIFITKGSSVDKHVIEAAKDFVQNGKVLISLDSLHTHAHVLHELQLYSPLVSVGSYIIVYDTAIEFHGHLDKNKDQRPWGPGNNPYTAVKQFLKENDNFVVDKEIEQRALITAAPGGFLKRVK